MPQIIIPNKFKCPITGKIMTSPVKTTLGDTYEKEAIENWLQKNNTDPVTGEKFPSKHLISDEQLKKQIDALHLCTEAELIRAINSNDPKKINELNFTYGHFNQA